MQKILIFGNSGSGKSTLARAFNHCLDLAHLDLDTLAWQPGSPPTRKPIAESALEISKFIDSNNNWVIEGCYSDLLALAAPAATKMIFMNLPIAACIENARQRPFEPHKYESKQAQDANLDMLIDWISQYDTREDTFSKAAHTALYNNFSGDKQIITNNQTPTDLI